MSEPFDPTKTYVCLDPNGGASTIEVDPSFWATIHEHEGLARGRLFAVLEMTQDWAHWEMHPHGEELLVVLSGAMDLVLETDGAERVIELRPGRAFLVPRGTWHRGVVLVPTQLLAVTHGRGTEQRPR